MKPKPSELISLFFERSPHLPEVGVTK